MIACPHCARTDQLQRSNTVHLWERGTLADDGTFIADESAELELDWESQLPEERYFCGACESVFTLLALEREDSSR